MQNAVRLASSGFALALALLVGVGLGWLLWSGHPDGGHASSAHSQEESEAAATVWTCSMHPQIRLPQPGACPICGMDLIPLRSDAAASGAAPVLVVSESERARMRIETVPVERRFAAAEVRMVGKVMYDESRLSNITAWVPGRIERLFVDYTGVTVAKGDHMVVLYSPELYSAQQELLQAKRAAAELARSDLPAMRESGAATLVAARERLRLWGLTPEQVEELESRGQPSENVTIYAPAGGVVVAKDAREGMYVSTGARIFTIADLSKVWVALDAYESDLAWLRYGQRVEFETEALPGERFTGTISFIDPVLDPRTRTVKVRVIVDNEDRRLKPEMFVRAVVRARVAAHGKVMDESLVGKWISPMHPEIVKDGPGQCDVCGMDLVPAEQLGYVSIGELENEKPLVIPVTAALVTGRRAVVYVERVDAEQPTYEGREVVLGPRAGDVYVVRSGLEAGERVVRAGAFKIDSALQIQAKPSMMNPPQDGEDAEESAAAPPPIRLSESAREKLANTWRRYAELRDSLAADDLDMARAAAGELKQSWASPTDAALDASSSEEWRELAARMDAAVAGLGDVSDIEAERAAFERVSNALVAIGRRTALAGSGTLYVVHCPMAFDGRGADWLQSEREVLNPYFGESMLHCGSVVEELAGQRDGGHVHER